ncbi:MAG: membrane protein insertion efficiency factor YidD [Patescibacteria group bacterium]
MKTILSFLIGLYQRTLSPDHGLLRFRYPNGYCRFYPTCSQYSRQALMTHGAIYGSYLSIKRIVSCNPWHTGGIDNVPNVLSPRAILKNK